MKQFVIIISAGLIIVSLSVFFRQLYRAESMKEKLVMTAALFLEPLDFWSSMLYLGLLGLAYSIIFM